MMEKLTMNRFKKAVSELRDHLGKDQTSITKLAAVETIGNTTRKELAAEKEKHEQAQRVAVARQEATVTAETEIRRLQQELDREKSRKSQAARELVVANKKIEALELKLKPPPIKRLTLAEVEAANKELKQLHELASPLLKNFGPVAKTIDDLRRSMRRAPKADCGVMATEVLRRRGLNLDVFNIDDIISDLSDDELLKLGRFVVCTTLMAHPCVVTSDLSFLEAHNLGAINVSLSSVRKYYKWYKPNVSTREFNELYNTPPPAPSFPG
jgi:hypothetical protein